MNAQEAFAYGLSASNALAESRHRRTAEKLNLLAGSSLAGGDYGSAAQTLLRGGQIDPGLAVMQAGQQQTQTQQERMRSAVPTLVSGLQQIRQLPMEQRASAGRQLASTLQQFGLPADQIDEDFSDATLDQELMSLQALIPQQPAEPFTLNKDAVRYLPNAGGGYDAVTNPNAGQPEPMTPYQAERLRLAQEANDRSAAANERSQSQQSFSQEQSLRKEWTSVSSDFSEVSRGYANIQNLAQNKDSASDLALIVAFTKVLDPGSVAREGEVQLTQQAAGLAQNASVWLRRLEDGKTLLPDAVRDAYVNAAGDLYQQIEQSYTRRQGEFSQIAESAGLDPSRVLLDFTAPPVAGRQEPLPPPQVGDVIDGYRYTGGDPREPGSWRAVQ